MPAIRLSKLPERSPIKLSVTVSPDLYAALSAYAELYAEAYGGMEPIGELIPAMLAAFLESDREFVRRRRAGGSGT